MRQKNGTMKNTGSEREKNMEILQAAHRAWQNGARLREMRLKCKNFTYGKQDVDNEFSRGLKVGAQLPKTEPETTNNLIHNLVKTVVGRWRANAEEGGRTMLSELDARALEEFLISGCCIQRGDERPLISGGGKEVVNVNLNKFFVNNSYDPLGRDIEIIGQLHDLSVSDLLRKVSGGSRRRAEEIRLLYTIDAAERIAGCSAALGADGQSSTRFWNSERGKCRAIEVWTLESREVLVCHDRSRAELFMIPIERAAEIRGKGYSTRWDIKHLWRCRWFSPMGDLLTDYYSPFGHSSHPFAVKMYPLSDGEVHSFVEGLIDQQKYVNRLINLMMRIIRSSAKGVLLYPQEALPDGFTWSDVRSLWSASDSILPFSTRFSSMKPEQVSANNTDIGAKEMLNLQMRLFEEISGVSSALQGRSGASNIGAGVYEQQVANATHALQDIYSSFENFLTERNLKLG